jgi:two-component system, NarL family, response regulator LiaR
MHVLGEPVRVAVVSPHELTRRGLEGLLAQAPDRVSVVLVEPEARELRGADVVVYDLAATERGDGQALAELAAGPVPVVALEVLGRGDLTEDALNLGVVVVVPRAVTSYDLVVAVEEAAAGVVVTSTAYRAANHADVRLAHGVTEREATILALVAAGLSNREIAEQLFLSINSVKTYIRSAYRRIGATTRSEAVLWAIRHRLAEPDPRSADDEVHSQGG